MRVLFHLVLCSLGLALATEEVKPLRQTLHGTLARVALTTIKEAVVVTASEGASHFQKLPGKSKKSIIVCRSKSLTKFKFFPLQRAHSSWLGMRI